jgi:hypothetical protein
MLRVLFDMTAAVGAKLAVTVQLPPSASGGTPKQLSATIVNGAPGGVIGEVLSRPSPALVTVIVKGGELAPVVKVPKLIGGAGATVIVAGLNS